MKQLARLTGRQDLPRLVAALIGTGLAGDYDMIVEQASEPAAKAS